MGTSCNFSSSTPCPSSSTPRLRLGVLELGLGGLERSRPSPPPPAVGLKPRSRWPNGIWETLNVARPATTVLSTGSVSFPQTMAMSFKKHWMTKPSFGQSLGVVSKTTGTETFRGGGGVPPFSVNFFPLGFREPTVRGGGGGTPLFR